MSEIGNISTNNYDIAISSTTIHVAYESDGKIYYVSRLKTGSTWTAPVEIAGGRAPSISISPTGTPHVVYGTTTSQIYEATSSGAWAPTYLFNGNYASLDYDGSGTAHLLIEGNFDGDSHVEFGYSSNPGSGWSAMTILNDGWYDSGYGYYFGQSDLAGTPSGYAYSFEFSNWQGRASWSEKSAQATGPGSASTSSPSLAWNTGASLGRNAIDFESGGEGGFVYSTGGNIYYHKFNGTAWGGQTFVGAGSDASIDLDYDFNIAYVGNLSKLYTFNGVNSELVQLDGNDLTGTKPIIEGDDNYLYLLFKDSSNKLQLVTTIPEPSTIALLVFAGSLSAILRRRK